MRLRLSPFVRSLTATHPGGRVTRGVAHALTGNTVAVSEDLSRMIQELAHTGRRRRDLERACTSPTSRRLLDWLVTHRFLIPAGSPSNLLQPFLSHRLVLPTMNPTVTCASPHGRTLVIRPKNLGISVTPRPLGRPVIIQETLPADAGLLIEAARDRRTLRWAIGGHRWGADRVLGMLRWLTAKNRQLIRLARPSDDMRGFQHHLHYLIQDFRADTNRSVAPNSARAFYRSTLRDVDENFDWVEPTVAHAFRYPTAVLGGMTYGERFFAGVWRELLARQRVRSSLDVLEAGGGTGTFARDMVRRARVTLGSQAPLRYTLVDWSPAALERQKRTLEHAPAAMRFLRQDAERLSLPRCRFDVIVANEMIADLRVRTHAAAESTPVGLFALLRRVRAHLRPDGIAALSEYGIGDGRTEQVDHFGHAEYSIDFRAARDYAISLGFVARIVPLATFIEADQDIDVLCGMQEHYACLNHALARFGSALPIAVWDREGFHRRIGEDVTQARITGLTFAPVRKALHYGPALDQFSVLILTAPSA